MERLPNFLRSYPKELANEVHLSDGISFRDSTHLTLANHVDSLVASEGTSQEGAGS